jgi:hypothetical protein
MKIVLFSLGLVLATSFAQAATSTFTWDKKEIESLKGKEVYSAYCSGKTSGFTKDVCDRVSKSTSFKKFKFKTLEWVDNGTIRVGDGPRTVEIKRGARPGSFAMNGKNFDFGAMSHDEIRAKISAALPRVSGASLFMSAAYADDEINVIEEMTEAVDLMASNVTDRERCKAVQKIVSLCLDDGSRMPGSENVITAMKNYEAQKTRSGHTRAAKEAFAAIKNFKDAIEQSRDLMYRSQQLQNECAVKFDGSMMQTEDAFHSCNGGIDNFKVEFDQSVHKRVLDDAVSRTTHKELGLRLGEIADQMENFYGRKVTPYEVREIKDAIAPAVK